VRSAGGEEGHQVLEAGGVELLTGDGEPVGALLGDQTRVRAERDDD
jgi:hypothetical protein